MMLEVVMFDGDWVVLIKEQNEITGNYVSVLRRIRGEYGEEFVNYGRARIPVSRELERARNDKSKMESLYSRVKALEGKYR